MANKSSVRLLTEEPNPHSRSGTRNTGVYPEHVLVAGASGGIGGSLCTQLNPRFPGIVLTRLARNPEQLPELGIGTCDLPLDLCEPKMMKTIVAQISRVPQPDWILIASGWLHSEDTMPERTLRELDPDHLEWSYKVNAVGPAMLIKHLVMRFNKAKTLKIGVLSARLGSNSDNRLGGWHAYRASKAALNMLIKNFAIEISRSKPEWCIVGLQPGTTDTPLSRPFQRGVRTQLHSADDTSRRLIQIMQSLAPEHSGNLYDRNGSCFHP